MLWRISLKAALALVLCLSPSLVDGAPRKGRRSAPSEDQGQVNPNAKVVDLFQAVEDKKILAQFEALATFEGVLTLTNRSTEPLNVELPLVFAAVPAIPKGPGAQGPGPQANAAGQLASLTPKSLGCVIDPRQRAVVGVDRERAKIDKPAEKKGAPAAKNAAAGKRDKADADKETNEADADETTADDNPRDADGKPAPKKTPAKTDNSKPKRKDDKQTSMVTVIPLAVGAILPLPVTCIGLEFDRLEATPFIVYTVAPLKDATKQPTLEVLLLEMAEGKIKDPLAAQAVAYHFSGKSWEELSPIFAAQIPRAKALAAQLEKKAKAKAAAAGDDKPNAQANQKAGKRKSTPAAVRGRRKKPVEDEPSFDE